MTTRVPVGLEVVLVGGVIVTMWVSVELRLVEIMPAGGAGWS
ncbi:hypothetical protein ACFQ1S_26105 [Kibdelosporangium lantanae]|uniref:Uncharacterized protein n=1 Tax=Kibdelosporangium lantanae TaxID=1497396 RepID=A0ABW3MDN1_9PSEU